MNRCNRSLNYFTLHIGQRENANEIRGPNHLVSRILRVQCKWNTCPQASCRDGAPPNGSVKQTMHISSASCLRGGRGATQAAASSCNSGDGARDPAQPCKHGRHRRSPRYPPHRCPHESTRTHAFLLYSYEQKNTIYCNFLKFLKYQM